MLGITEDLPWEGLINFGVVDEAEVIGLGLFNDPLGIMNVIESGMLKFKRISTENKVTNYARSYMATVLANSATMPLVLPSQMELGTGTGTPSATDTDLWSPSAGTLKPCSSIAVYNTYYAQYIVTWQTTDPIVGTWTETGLKDANGNLWAHSAITSNLVVNTGEMLVGQWNVQIIAP